MKLKQQIILLIVMALLVPAIVISSISIYKINSRAKADIEQYRSEEFSKLKQYMKHITDIAYGVVEVQHKELLASGISGDSLRMIMTQECLAELSAVRFDKGEGYFWVTDNKMPYPTMIMHAEKVNLKGVTLDDPKHNVEKNEGRNIYQVRAELCNANGEAFVEYIMKKPGTEEVENKISYSRLYAPLGWIVSTGFYTDQIERSVLAKREALTQQIKEVVFTIMAVAVFILIVGLVVSFYFSKQLTNAILSIKEKLGDLANGRRVDQIVTSRKDEVGEMTGSLNFLVEGLRTYTSFAKEIGEGNLVQSFKPLSEEDVLGNELLSMRDNLKKAADEKSIRDWVNEGQAMLGEVLRRNNSDTKGLAEEILKELVKYLKVNQGALFVMTEANNERWLEMTASYAYDKKKFVDKRIELGHGLVGQCVLERSTIHLREVPEKYISITSGLGQALPRTIIIVPLIHNEAEYGAIELASFKTFNDYEISFIEKIAESIASTIAAVQVNERTKHLLEQSQQMAEELKAQEEEVRQNMEELSATQEQMARQIDENKKVQDDLQTREKVFALTTILSEADVYGNITMVNDKLCQIAKYYREELIGKPHNIFRHDDMPKELFKIFWETIKSGKVFKGIIKNRAKDGSHYWVDATIVPVTDKTGTITKYMGARYHITDDDVAVELYNRQALRLNLPLLEKPFLKNNHSNGHHADAGRNSVQTQELK
jgi:PAS domain S-box-containing protein